MPARITVTATGGPCKGREFVFTSRTLCTVGRSDNCLLRIQGDGSNLTVSRRHCVLDIDPPTVRVRDLGSLNGTFVNGRKIGQREKGTPPWEAVPADLDGVELRAGDRLVVGSSEFLIDIQNSAPEREPDARVGPLDEDGLIREGATSGQSCAACC
jgi:pSer/pThr/pTyr-binding forkhead associated (FHA) protein